MFHLNKRTVHFYVRKGLLPAPEFKGAQTKYSDAHVDRLRAIRYLLHGERLPLNKVKHRLASLGPEAIKAIGAPAVTTSVETIEAEGAACQSDVPMWVRE